MNRTTCRAFRVIFARAVAICLGCQLVAGAAQATLISTGTVFPGNLGINPTTTSQITIGADPAGGSLTINANTTGNGVTSVVSNYTGSIAAVIGYGAGSTGNMTVTGNGNVASASFTSQGGIVLGYLGGTGNLGIFNGGRVQSTGAGESLAVGWGTNSSGAVSMTGASSQLSTGGRLEVGFGNGSNGTLFVNAGGQVQAGTNPGFGDGAITIGLGEGSYGGVQIEGAGSILRGTGLIAGNFSSSLANTASLSVLNGGQALLTGGASLGSTGGTAQLFVQGSGAYMQVAGTTYIGGFGQGLAIVTNGGVLDASGHGIRVSGGGSGTGTEYGGLTVAAGGEVIADYITVYTGGVLWGAGGTITGDVALMGGTFSPGDSPGTMNIDGELELYSGVLNLERDGALRDLLNVSGAVFFGRDLTINLLFSNYVPPLGENLRLEDYFGGSGRFLFDSAFDFSRQLNVSGLDDSYFSVSFGNYSRVFGTPPPVVVPEPPTSALIALALLAMGTALQGRRRGMLGRNRPAA